MSWECRPLVKKLPTLNSPVLIEGLPGIGNVGKVAADFIIDELKAKRLFSLSSYDMPNSVFVNEKNLVELPVIEVYYKQFEKKKGKKQRSDLLILTGDIQPTEERSSYEFTASVLEMFRSFGGSEIITLGGIGLQQIPKKPQVFCTGNSRKAVIELKKKVKINEKLYGVVGPIIGVSGLLVGLAGKTPALCLLAETLGHPAYLGINGARELIKVLDKKYSLGIDIKQLDSEVEELENELERTKDLSLRSKKTALTKMKSRMQDTEYIG